jgi:hypothetical protein
MKIVQFCSFWFLGVSAIGFICHDPVVGGLSSAISFVYYLVAIGYFGPKAQEYLEPKCVQK